LIEEHVVDNLWVEMLLRDYDSVHTVLAHYSCMFLFFFVFLSCGFLVVGCLRTSLSLLGNLASSPTEKASMNGEDTQGELLIRVLMAGLVLIFEVIIFLLPQSLD
jgi:hypothetical protein